MFEKEARNYAEENKKVYGSDEYADITDYNNVKKAFQKGAEFGYNKANEWHKQDIESSKKCYTLLKQKDEEIKRLEKVNEQLKQQKKIMKECCFNSCLGCTNKICEVKE